MENLYKISASPDERVINKENRNEIVKAINELPDKCKEIFKMNRFDNLKYREIAEILDISVKTVETQMGRALKKLRENLQHLISIIGLFFPTFFDKYL